MSHYPEDPGTKPEYPSIEGPEIQLGEANVILLFGCTGTGKTSFANMASGSGMQVGKGLRSSTKHLQASNMFQLDNQPVVIVDCPGFNDTYLTETEILRRLAEFLTKAYTSKSKIVGLLYFHNISDTRVGGASFLHMKLFMALCGTTALKNAIYVTNMWSEPPTEDQIMREAELRETDKFFGSALVEGAQMARHYNTRESANDVIRKLIGKDPVITKLQRQLVDEKMSLEDTDAGVVIGEDLEDDLLKQQQEMNDLKGEKEKALESDNQNWLRRLEAQEERTKAKEQQLIDQLRILKSKKKTSPELTSPQGHHDQGAVIHPDLNLASQFQEQIEAKMNELTQNAGRHSRPLHSCLPSQQEWDRQKNDELMREIERINAEAAYSRSRSHGNRGPVDFIIGAGSAVISTLARFPGLRTSTSSSAIGDSHHSRGTLCQAQGPTMENVVGHFRPSSPARSPSLDETRHQQGQASSSSRPRRSGGHVTIHDDREVRGPPRPARSPSLDDTRQQQGHDSGSRSRRSGGYRHTRDYPEAHVTSSRNRSQGHEGRGVSGRRNSSLGYEY